MFIHLTSTSYNGFTIRFYVLLALFNLLKIVDTQSLNENIKSIYDKLKYKNLEENGISIDLLDSLEIDDIKKNYLIFYKYKIALKIKKQII